MICNLRRLVSLTMVCLLLALACLVQVASALDTANTLMGIDGMVMRAGGIFRDPGSFGETNGNDGYNTFQFGAFAVANAVTTGKGKYDAFRFQKTDVGDCCISHNARINSNTPETVTDPTATPIAVSFIPNPTNALLPIIDRAAFGQQFDPDQYQIQVKFKPLMTKATADSLGTNPFPTNPTYPPISAALENSAPFFTVALDQLGGFVWDAEGGGYKRAGEQIFYNIGSAANPINNWYVTAPKDAEGYAIWTVPVTSPSNVARTYYYSTGSGDFREGQVLANGGRVFNSEAGTWSDATIGYGPGFQQFGGGPSDPNNPNNKLNVPNGVGLMSLGAPNAQLGLSLEIKSIALTKTNPGQIMARIDSSSGISFRFGSGLAYGGNQPGINVGGTNYFPLASDQISRFDANGMTNLKINMRTPDDPNEAHRFLIRGAPSDAVFDATNAVVNVRAKLLEPLTNAGVAQDLTIYTRARKGSDTAAGTGADDWSYNLDLSQFNTSSMTTVSIPLAAFTRSLTAPLGFLNAGDGLLTNFGIYEFGGIVPANTGLLKLELEYMEIRLPAVGLPGDFNNNHVVDAADYTLWRDHLGAAEGTLLNGNGNGGTIDQTDYDLWKANFGETNGAGALSGASVPEPGTFALLVIASIGLFAGRRR